MALHPELEYRCGVVTTDGCLLGVVTNPHTNVSTTSTTPDVIGKFKSTRETEIRVVGMKYIYIYIGTHKN